MPITVSYLVGRFPVLYERGILEEIVAVENEGIRARVVAFHPSGKPLPDEFAVLRDKAAYLDLARPQGKLVSGIASLAAGVAAGIRSPGLFVTQGCTYPFGSRMAAFWRRARLGRLLRIERPDVVHAEFGHLGLLALPVVKRANVPLVVSFRGQDVLLLQRVAAEGRARLFQYAGRVLVRSKDMRRDLIRLDCPAQKVFVQPSGVNVRSLPFRERTPPDSDRQFVILSVGRLVPKKGMDDGLRALARCGSGQRLRIAGDGPEWDRLRRIADELGLQERVTFLGALAHGELIAEMLKAHLLLVPCRTAPDGEKEGVPNSIKEAQATGLPIVATRHAGIPECVVHGESGLLCDEGDVDGLARNLATLLSHPERWPAMGRNGWEIIKTHHDLRKLAPQLVRHYGDVMQMRSV